MEILSKFKTIETTYADQRLHISLEGRLDTTTASLLEKVILDMDESVECVYFDFSRLEYISSAGLRVLLICQKKMDGDKNMEIVHVNPMIKEIFDATGFSSIFHIHTDDETTCELSFDAFLCEKVKMCADLHVFSFANRTYTWLDIEQNTRAIAAELMAQGVKQRTHVAICGMNSPNWIFTFFAIQRLGAIAVLLNFASTPTELEQFLRIGDVTHEPVSSFRKRSYG